jgi:LCP family protein required for cell wall assembly
MNLDALRRRSPAVQAAVAALAVLLFAGVVGAVSVWWSATRALERTSLDAVSDRSYDEVAGAELVSADGPLNVLVVGSDSREGLSDEERQRLSTGDFDGDHTDTILLFQVTDDGVSVVSFPRDLKVTVDDETMKINAVAPRFGADRLVAVVEASLGLDVDHYVAVAIPSFLDIVDAAGGVEICLEEELRDSKSGADFAPGCHDMDGADALAYVRSRSGPRGDFARAERQQTFLRALAERVTSLGVLARPDRLRSVVTEVAGGLEVDDELTVPRMLSLARSLRGALDDGIDATTLPAWPSDEDGIAYVIAYPPGVDALAEALGSGAALPAAPEAAERGDVPVGLWRLGDADVATVESVLFFAGLEPQALGAAPEGLAGDGTTVLHAPGREAEARWLASLVGADVEPFPAGVEPPDGIELVVAVGDVAPPGSEDVLAPAA